MGGIETITDAATVVAIILRSSFQKDGLTFLTPEDFSQQLAYMKHPEGHVIKAHVHKMAPRAVQYTLEVLLVRSGKVKVNLYRADRSYLQSATLSANDVILLAAGGHGFEFLEPTEMVEIKQGPYLGFELDKEQFEGIESRDAGREST